MSSLHSCRSIPQGACATLAMSQRQTMLLWALTWIGLSAPLQCARVEGVVSGRAGKVVGLDGLVGAVQPQDLVAILRAGALGDLLFVVKGCDVCHGHSLPEVKVEPDGGRGQRGVVGATCYSIVAP